MIPTKQTILHDPDNGIHGNCFSAVLASILHLPIDEIPIFSNPVSWIKDVNEWLLPYGLAYCIIEGFDAYLEAYGIRGIYHEIAGTTSRSNEVLHACVAKDGEVIHDPHPDNSGLSTIANYGFFISLKPWEHKCEVTK